LKAVTADIRPGRVWLPVMNQVARLHDLDFAVAFDSPLEVCPRNIRYRVRPCRSRRGSSRERCAVIFSGIDGELDELQFWIVALVVGFD